MMRTGKAWRLLIILAPIGVNAQGLDWMAGHWCARDGETVTEELWLPASENLMLALNRTTRDSKTIAFEYLRIEGEGGGMRYLAQPGGQPPTVFALTRSAPGHVRFENPDHDFPRVIEYRREGERLDASIAGPGEDGTQVIIPIPFTRCDTAPVFETG